MIVISLDDRPPSPARWVAGFRSGFYHFLRNRYPNRPALQVLAEVYGPTYSIAAITPAMRRAGH